jgi:hypothetical protein
MPQFGRIHRGNLLFPGRGRQSGAGAAGPGAGTFDPVSSAFFAMGCIRDPYAHQLVGEAIALV